MAGQRVAEIHLGAALPGDEIEDLDDLATPRYRVEFAARVVDGQSEGTLACREVPTGAQTIARGVRVGATVARAEPSRSSQLRMRAEAVWIWGFR